MSIQLDTERMWKMVKAAEQYNQQPPTKCPKIERFELECMFNRSRMEREELQQETGICMVHHAVITGTSHYCAKPLSKLKSIHLEQMKVPFIHEGHFLACKVIDTNGGFGMEALVEDTKGQAQLVTFYNCHGHLLNGPKWLRPGMIVLIKEPHMKYAINEAKLPWVIVDSPSDIAFVDKTNREMLESAGALCWFVPETLSAEELKEQGNLAFRENKEDAFGLYERALALITDDHFLAPVIHLNMAAALLELKRYPETIMHAEKALNGGANKQKAFYRIGCAAYGMRSWSEAIGHFESALKENPKCPSTVEQMAKAKARLAESLIGKYDLRKLLDDEQRGQRCMEVADFCGPVKIADIPGKGKGLIVTQDVPKGTLLLAEKAYAMASQQDLIRMSSMKKVRGYNLITNELNETSQMLCKTEVIQKLRREPNTAPALYGLYAGEGVDRTMPIPMDGVIDTGRIERICSLNWFGTDSSDEDQMVTKLERETLKGTGLWIMLSYINHACLSNTHKCFFGDLVMVRAISDLKKGDELTTIYKDPLDIFEERSNSFIQKWGFTCECHLCELDRHESKELVNERKQLYAKFNKLRPAHAVPSLAELLPLVNAIRQTYGDRAELRTQMVGPLMALTKVYSNLNQPAKVLEGCYEALDAVGHRRVYLYLILAQTYAQMGNRNMTKTMATKAYELVQLKIGPMDKNLFVHIFPEFLLYMLMM